MGFHSSPKKQKQGVSQLVAYYHSFQFHLNFLLHTHQLKINQMRMNSIFKLQGNRSLPLSHAEAQEGNLPGIRRRLSSISINSAPAADWAVRRSKSVSSMGEFAGNSIKRWWELGWGWILSRKPAFASDLEMNEEETAAIGTQNRGSWRHVLYRVASQLGRKFVRGHDGDLPHTFRHEYPHKLQNNNMTSTPIH